LTIDSHGGANAIAAERECRAVVDRRHRPSDDDQLAE
jgi:hypothetical protein